VPGDPQRQAYHPEHLGDFTLRRDVLRICALALPIGALSAVVAALLLQLIGLCTNLFFHGRLSSEMTSPNPSTWLLALLVPVAGGLVVGLMARFGSDKIRGHGIPEAIEAILTRGSKVSPKVSVLKPLSAAISIGSGGPFGAEGPIIMTGGSCGSVLAQFLRLTADQRKTLMVAGAAAGMAATFNAPLASILLAVELLLFEWRPRSFLPTVASVVAATIVRSYLLGSDALFPMVRAAVDASPLVYLCCGAAGVLGGLLAYVATKLVYFSEDVFAKLPVHWMWWPAIGGLVIGIGGLVEPRALGVGYDVIGAFLQGNATMSLILGILVVKTLIWGLSLGSGTSGGVLAPMFMLGGALGALEAQVFPAVSPGFWALMGLAAVIGGVMRSPLTGIVFSLELTHMWSALLPVVVSASAAYLVSCLLLQRSVLTEKIARRGYHLSREYTVDPLEGMFVGEVMDDDISTLSADEPLSQTIGRLLPDENSERQRLFPVLDGRNRIAGVVTRRELLDIGRNGHGGRTVGDVATREVVSVHPDQTLREVAFEFAQRGVARAPVVDRDDPSRLIGMVTLTRLLEGRLRAWREDKVRERPLGWNRKEKEPEPA
jgi:H+/Cl- antiporter ClcA/CBS domain-containing protein